MQHDTPETIYAELSQRAAAASNPRLVLTFPVELPASTTPEEVAQWLSASGFTRVQAEREVATVSGPRKVLDVVADRFRLDSVEKARVLEAIEVALKRGSGRLNVYVINEPATHVDSAQKAIESVASQAPETWRFSTGLHCPQAMYVTATPLRPCSASIPPWVPVKPAAALAG